MAGIYTFDDFQNAAQQSGLLGNFSDADLKLARINPDAGMSLLSYKQQYNNATSDEAKALAHAGAENVRKQYGGYSGGAAGADFKLEPMSPGGYTAPSYTSQYAGRIEQMLAEPAKYESQYAGQIEQMLGALTKPKEFTYDASADPVFSQYRKQYLREGARATQDTMGAAAAMTGGIPSSYAVTSAAQAGNYYNAQLADKIPELYQQAYTRYLNEFQMQQQQLSALQSQEQREYDQYLDKLQMQQQRLSALQSQEQREYDRFLADRNFGYQQHLDEYTSQQQERENALTQAALGAQYGDYSGLHDMGIDTSNNPADYERRLNEAMLAAQYGDYSKLQAMGIDMSNNTAERERLLNEAMAAAQYGDYSKLQALGIDITNADYDRRLAEAQLAAQLGDYSKLRAMGILSGGTSGGSSAGYSGGSSGGYSGGSSGGTSYRNSANPLPAPTQTKPAGTSLADRGYPSSTEGYKSTTKPNVTQPSLADQMKQQMQMQINALKLAGKLK